MKIKLPSPTVYKEILDTVNSLSWFLMDGFWMLGVPKLGYFFILPTIVTGFLLLLVEKRPAITLINVAIFFWILMNTFWMLSETLQNPTLLLVARISFGLGVSAILVAAFVSKDLRDTFSHFRRFRVLKWH
ncbi:MAG: hypothetical protein JNL01_01570 [Bdellovibrionales bacterium]|nr:hypothetical protein [Bdellovibrionales bacterium]